MIEKTGLKCLTAGCGQEAVRAVEEEDFGLVLMDLIMPGMDGFEAAAAIRDKTRAPIVAMSATDAAEDRRKIEQAGFAGFLSKPVTRESLLKVIKQHLGKVPRQSGSADFGTGNPGGATMLDIGRLDPDPAFVVELLDMFFEDAQKRDTQLKAAVEADDGSAVIKAAHSIKGMAGAIKVSKMADKAYEIEVAARAGDMDLVRSLYVGFRKTLDRLLDEIKTRLEELRSA